jgi:CO/xanthine dehydrogenase FAD-binding subunit
MLAERGDDAKVLAGGQSLIPMLAFRLASPSVLVDLERIHGLGEVRRDEDVITIGAMTRHRAVENHATLLTRSPMLAEAVAEIGHVAIRNRGTVGGSLAHADPAAEWGALALALDAEVEVLGPRGARRIAADELFVSYFTTALELDEILTSVSFRLPAAEHLGSAFLEVARRRGDFAIVGVAVSLVLGENGQTSHARVALIGAHGRPIRATSTEDALRDQLPTDELIRDAAELATQELDPPSDLHASADNRRHLARVLTRRAVAIARDRAAGTGTR